MRKALIMMAAGLTGLAGCGADSGWHGDGRQADTPYGRYVAAREAALQGTAPDPRAIPVVQPHAAATPGQIAARRTATAAVTDTAPRQRPARRAATGYAGTQDVLTRYAAATTNDPGQARYARNRIGTDPARACAAHATPEIAQIAFIARGGPQADPLGLDPDGDGFVCGWDPRPLRALTP